MRRLIGVLALGGVLTVLAAGCGGGGSGGAQPLDKADYVKQMQSIGQSLSTSLSTLSAASSSAKKAATALSQVQTKLRDAADKIKGITPPTEIATEHEKLGDAVREFADELGPVITKLKGGNLSALSSLTNLQGITDIQTASTAIQNKGYKIGG